MGIYRTINKRRFEGLTTPERKSFAQLLEQLVAAVNLGVQGVIMQAEDWWAVRR
jgi:hypothetical protein